MITNNFIEYMGAQGLAPAELNDARYINVTGTVVYNSFTAGYESRIYIGSGTTTPSKSDYKIEQEVSNFRATKSNNLFYGTYKNSGSSDVTITEVALLWTSREHSPICMVREVLETPVVVKAGETQVFTVSFNFS